MIRFGSRFFSSACAILAIGGLSTTFTVDAATLCAVDTSTSESLLQSTMNDHRAKAPNATRLCMADATGSRWTANSGTGAPAPVNIAGFARHDSLGDSDVTHPDRRIMTFSGRSGSNASRTGEAGFNDFREHDRASSDLHPDDRNERHGRSLDSNRHVRDWEDRLRHKRGHHHPHMEKNGEPMTAVPLPAAAVLFAPGLAILGFMLRRNSTGRKTA